MSLEDSITRLARAVEVQGEGSAVGEIIRQRDAALKQSERWKADADFYCTARDKYYRDLETERRRSRALRAVIKRMKAEATNDPPK